MNLKKYEAYVVTLTTKLSVEQSSILDDVSKLLKITKRNFTRKSVLEMTQEIWEFGLDRNNEYDIEAYGSYTITFPVKFSLTEANLIEEAANEIGVSVSEFIRVSVMVKANRLAI